MLSAESTCVALQHLKRLWEAKISAVPSPNCGACLQDLVPGCLDDYIQRIMPMIDSQLFGGIAEEKEAGAFAGTREAKKMRAYDTYQLLAQGITFKTQLVNLLSLVRLPCSNLLGSLA